MKRLVFLIFFLLILIAFLIKFLSPQSIKNKIYSFLVPEKYKVLTDNISRKDKIIENYKKVLEKTSQGYLIENKIINSNSLGSFNVKDFIIEDKFFENYKNISSRWNYIEKYNDNILFTYHNGSMFFFNINDIYGEKLKINIIETNLSNFIDQSNENFLLGVRDTYIDKNQNLYVSLLKNLDSGCNNILVVKSKINLKKMDFKVFFEQPDDCSIRSHKDESDWRAGGALGSFSENKISLTIGDFSTLTDAQDNKNNLGKVLEINSEGKFEKMLAIGLRNPTSLYNYNNKNLFISEIGPKSGDEINIIHIDDSVPVNFGWPFATYGKHDYEPNFNYSKEHDSKGYKEPLFYGTDENSITPSKLIVSNNFFINSPHLITGTLKERNLTIFKIENNFDNKKINLSLIDKILFEERVRDMINSENLLILSLEDPVILRVMTRIN